MADNGMPTWAIVLIVIAAVVILGGGSCFTFLRA